MVGKSNARPQGFREASVWEYWYGIRASVSPRMSCSQISHSYEQIIESRNIRPDEIDDIREP